MSTAFDAFEPDGTPRVFIGMHRPPYESAYRAALAEGPGRYCYGGLIYNDTIRERWLAGQWDVPMYVDVDLATALLASQQSL